MEGIDIDVDGGDFYAWGPGALIQQGNTVHAEIEALEVEGFGGYSVPVNIIQIGDDDRPLNEAEGEYSYTWAIHEDKVYIESHCCSSSFSIEEEEVLLQTLLRRRAERELPS